MIEILDYCGINLGKNVDKSELFKVFYGELETAPMIMQSFLNLECKVVKTINTKNLSGTELGHEIFIGEIINAYADNFYVKDEKPDIKKLNPILYSSKKYWKLSNRIANAFSIGNNCTVGAGAIVVGDIPDNKTVVGLWKRDKTR